MREKIHIGYGRRIGLTIVLLAYTAIAGCGGGGGSSSGGGETPSGSVNLLNGNDYEGRKTQISVVVNNSSNPWFRYLFGSWQSVSLSEQAPGLYSGETPSLPSARYPAQLGGDGVSQVDTYFDRWANEVNSDREIERVLKLNKGSTIDDYLFDPAGDYPLLAPDNSVEMVDAVVIKNGKAFPVMYKGEMDGDIADRLESKFGTVIWLDPCLASDIQSNLEQQLSDL